jgi:tyrosyl-tRNA synthetase
MSNETERTPDPRIEAVDAAVSAVKISSRFSAEEIDGKIELVTRNLQEVLNKDVLRKVLLEQGRDLKIYWGTAPTGRPHIGYLVPLVKLADFLKAGCSVTVLFADLHAYLDNMKAPWTLLRERTAYYEELIRAVLTHVLLVDTSRLRFVVGTSYQLSEKYTLDVYRMAAMTTLRDARKAGAEVVREVESPLLSSAMYPGLQALDEEFLDVDAQFGGVDQRKIFVLAETLLPRLGYRKRAHLMNEMLPGLSGAKMSSSEPDSKIDFLDDAAAVTRKMRRAFCAEGEVENNGVLAFIRAALYPILALRAAAASTQDLLAPQCSGAFIVPRNEKYGGNVSFETYAELEASFVAKEVHPGDLKAGVVAALNDLLVPVIAHFAAAEKTALLYAAYPEDAPKPPKQKVVKQSKKTNVRPPKPDAQSPKCTESASDDVSVAE